LERSKLVLGDEDSVAASAGDRDWFPVVVDLLDEREQALTCFSGRDDHVNLLRCTVLRYQSPSWWARDDLLGVVQAAAVAIWMVALPRFLAALVGVPSRCPTPHARSRGQDPIGWMDLEHNLAAAWGVEE
jgi:hypothetical protein